LGNRLRDKQSDSMFIFCSKQRVPITYDTLATIGFLKLEEGKELFGLDIGGGIGTFSEIISENIDCKIDIIDPSKSVINKFSKSKNLKLHSTHLEDFKVKKKYDFIFINLVLHHIIDKDFKTTYNKQINFLTQSLKYLKPEGKIFIQENYYESFFGNDWTGKLIYFLTKLKFIEKLTRKLGANTAGEGVRFRSHKSWEEIFRKCGMKNIIEITVPGVWNLSLLEKFFLLCCKRYQTLKILTLK